MPNQEEKTILATVKDALGIPISVEVFDVTLLMHINTVFNILREFGVENRSIFAIDSGTVWSSYLEDSQELEMVKTDVYLRVRLMFDPPTSSFVLNSIQEQVKELEWRLNVLVDSGEEDI